jgi:peptidoglycan biosynthesis protein MviN/MurJ (putative lipid II flippase)
MSASLHEVTKSPYSKRSQLWTTFAAVVGLAGACALCCIPLLIAVAGAVGAVGAFLTGTAVGSTLGSVVLVAVAYVVWTRRRRLSSCDASGSCGCRDHAC